MKAQQCNLDFTDLEYFQNSIGTIHSGKIFIKNRELILDVIQLKKITIIKETRVTFQAFSLLTVFFIGLMIFIPEIPIDFLIQFLLSSLLICYIIILYNRNKYFLSFCLEVDSRRVCVPIEKKDFGPAIELITKFYQYRLEFI